MWIKSSFTIPAVAAISFCLIGGPVPASAGQVAGVCPGEGDCGEPHGTPGCENEECCLLVCAIEPFCCKVEWDEICVEIAIFLGCVAGPGDGELIATGGDASIDGYMDVTSDGLGAEAVSFNGGPAWDDNYKPVGGPLQNPSFTTTTFLYTDTTALAMTLHSGSTGVWGRHGIFFLITADEGAFDTNGDGVNDTRVVDFVVSGGLSLDVTCTQHVERFLSVGGLPVATWTVNYDITNTGGASTFRIVRWGDVNSSWVGDATDDIVGTGTNEAAKCDRFVYIGEDGAPNFSITLSTNDPDAAYVGSKQDFDPDCEGPDIPFGSGTDSGQVWALHGFFDSYINQIAGVGQNADGESGTAPDDGCDPPILAPMARSACSLPSRWTPARRPLSCTSTPTARSLPTGRTAAACPAPGTSTRVAPSARPTCSNCCLTGGRAQAVPQTSTTTTSSAHPTCSQCCSTGGRVRRNTSDTHLLNAGRPT